MYLHGLSKRKLNRVGLRVLAYDGGSTSPRRAIRNSVQRVRTEVCRPVSNEWNYVSFVKPTRRPRTLAKLPRRQELGGRVHSRLVTGTAAGVHLVLVPQIACDRLFPGPRFLPAHCLLVRPRRLSRDHARNVQLRGMTPDTSGYTGREVSVRYIHVRRDCDRSRWRGPERGRVRFSRVRTDERGYGQSTKAIRTPRDPVTNWGSRWRRSATVTRGDTAN